jgi:hypothetical protein
MVTGEHFAHHKFIVFTDPKATTKPTTVWTGSTNLTYGGVCTQANNGILIKDNTIATRFFQQWKELVKDVGGYPASLSTLDAKPVSNPVDGAKVTAWFAPNPMIGPKPKKGKGNKYGDHPDLKYARQLIQNAQEGILFLVFNPGFQGTLLNDILDLLNNPAKNKKLYIHGVANQDPTGGADKSPLIFVHRNKLQRSDTAAENNIVLPAAVSAPPTAKAKDKAAAAALQKWVKMVNDYWQSEPTGLGMVRVHSKVIIVDPLGKHPVIITGSIILVPKPAPSTTTTSSSSKTIPPQPRNTQSISPRSTINTVGVSSRLKLPRITSRSINGMGWSRPGIHKRHIFKATRQRN